mmetsp:Transcript_8827/g.16862  ORF Transcript_8827/g.16862 Transcript_8827/m.16862 type:complete len:209 (-) Transcript_8827:1324-1950(-)
MICRQAMKLPLQRCDLAGVSLGVGESLYWVRLRCLPMRLPRTQCTPVMPSLLAVRRPSCMHGLLHHPPAAPGHPRRLGEQLHRGHGTHQHHFLKRPRKCVGMQSAIMQCGAMAQPMWIHRNIRQGFQWLGQMPPRLSRQTIGCRGWMVEKMICQSTWHRTGTASQERNNNHALFPRTTMVMCNDQEVQRQPKCLRGRRSGQAERLHAS